MVVTHQNTDRAEQNSPEHRQFVLHLLGVARAHRHTAHALCVHPNKKLLNWDRILKQEAPLLVCMQDMHTWCVASLPT